MKKHRVLAAVILLLAASSIIAAGTYAWFGIAQNFTNEFTFEPYDIKLIKKDEETGILLQGAVFDLCETETGELFGRYITDKNGEIVIYGLDRKKEYYFIEKSAPYGYGVVDIDQKYEVIPGITPNITVTNKRLNAALTITKRISDTDTNGDPYIPNATDTGFEFEFTVQFGQDPDDDTEYTYYINGIPDTVQNGGQIYLRDGETAVFENIKASTYYKVTEKNYFKIDYLESGFVGAPDDFNCGDKHELAIGTGSGWMTFADNNIGHIRIDGSSSATFTNTKVHDGYEVFMSSLVVVDRILANEEDIDPEKGFSVTAVIGDEPLQSYYYEVVHVEDTVKAVTEYTGEYEYYHRNDPGVPTLLTPQSIGTFSAAFSAAPLAQNYEFSNVAATLHWLNAPLQATAALSNFDVSSVTGFIPPLHEPQEVERWKDIRGNIQMLEESEGNTITVNLHHGSALIIYGIPTGTHYTVEQVDYRYIDGYIIDSTVKTQGMILPDLDVLDDNDTDDEMKKLRRVRADIYNYFVFPIMKTITLEKIWEHGNNPSRNRPNETTVEVINLETLEFDSRTLTAKSEWKNSVEVLKYNVVTGKLFEYDAREKVPPDYEADIKKVGDNFTITNTYKDAPLSTLTVSKIVEGIGADESKRFNFTVEIDGIGTTSFALSNGDSKEFSDIPVGSYYTVTEDNYLSEGYTTSDIGSSGTVSRRGAEAIFTNTYDESIVTGETGSITLTKHVEGVGGDKNKSFRFTVNVGTDKYVTYLKHNETWPLFDIPVGTPYEVIEDNYSSDGYVTTSSNAVGYIEPNNTAIIFINSNYNSPEKASLTVSKKVVGGNKSMRFGFTAMIGGIRHEIALADGEKYTFSDIPVGTPYSVVEKDYSKDGYITESTAGTGTLTKDSAVVSFTNRYMTVEGNGSLTVTKTATGNFIDTAKTFRFTVIIGSETHNFTLRHGESKIFAELSAGTSYSVVEDDYYSEGYVTRSVGASGNIQAGENTAKFINEYTGTKPPKPEPGMVQIAGQKTWVHGKNPPSDQPTSILVYALSGGNIVAQAVVSEKVNWLYFFNLPQYNEEGVEIKYTISEENVENYQKTVKGSDLVNTYKDPNSPKTDDTTAIWVWLLLLIPLLIVLRLVVFYKRRKGNK